MRRLLLGLLALVLLTTAAPAQIVWQTGLGPFPWLHWVGPGLQVLARGTSTVGPGPHSVEVPVPLGEVVTRFVTWTVGVESLQTLPGLDAIQVDGQWVNGLLCGQASPAPDWDNYQLGVYAGFLPETVVPGDTWLIEGAGDKPLLDDPSVDGYGLTVVLISELPGFPDRSHDLFCGYTSTDSNSHQPLHASATLDLSLPYPGGGLQLVLDALDGQPDDGSGLGSDSLFVQGDPAGGVLAGTGSPLDAWQGAGPGPGGYDLLDDDPTLAALVLGGTGQLTIDTVRAVPVGDSVGHSLAVVVHDVAAGPWTSAGPASAFPGRAPPWLAATGTLTPGSANALLVAGAPPGGTVQFVAGAAPLLLPFKGGVLGPQPTLVVPLPADLAGRATLSFSWHGLPAGTQVWAQAWMQDAGAWAATRTLLGTSG